MASFRCLLLRVISDILLCLLAYLPWIVLKTAATPFKRGFFCDDESLKHPYFDSTISSSVMISLSLIIPLLTVLVIECIRFFSTRGEDSNRSLIVQTAPSQIELHPSVLLVYSTTVIFLFGAAATESFTNIGKYAVGRLRPHFFTVCDPDYTSFNCTDSRRYQTYVTDYECKNTDAHRLEEMRLSFPSGHASLSVYAAVFFTMYIQQGMAWRGSQLLRHLLQLIVIWMAGYTCISRITDYKHHWSDVVAGALLGAAIAYLVFRYGISVFKKSPGLVSTNSRPICAGSETGRCGGLISSSGRPPATNYRAIDQHSV